MGTFIDIDNPSSYKNCSKKQYEIYVCMPPKNTIVINKLEQADVVKALGGKTYFTVDEIEKMQKSNPPMLAQLQQLVAQGRAYAVTDATPFVLCGTVGEMWTIKADKLASTYNFLQGGQPLAINQQTLNQRLHGKYLDWTLIRTSPQATAGQNMACFVPSSQKGQIPNSWGSVLNYNGVGIKHGKGDFIVCTKLPNGQPNLADRWVVNGEIFATTYNNQGWVDCLNQSSIKNITIDSLPRLVPQQTAIDNGVDFNVFKQKCDTIMKELQKIYKFNVKSNTYETVKDYTGFAYEVEIKFDCYVAKYVVGGNFSHTYSVKSQTSDGMTTKTITADETYVWFACSAIRSNSAIAMSIRPKTDGLYLGGWAFPNNSDTKVSTEWRCRVGTIKDINCAEEVKLFKEKCNGRDVFIDNRKSESKDYLNAEVLRAGIEYSSVQGSIGIEHVLEEVYNKLTNDTLKERVSLCYKEYINLDIGHGSASLAFAKRKETEVKNSMIGTSILSHKMNLSALIKYLVSACQQDETKYNALLVLYYLSENALSEAILKLFYDTKNPSLNTLWKRLDLLYMFNNKIDLYIYEKSEHNINNQRVCIDFHLNDFDGIFVRCVYTASGNYGFDFIPKTPITEHGVGSTYSFDKDYDNYLSICKQLRDSCYRCFTEFTDSSRTFVNNLPKYLINNDYEYLSKLGDRVDIYFKIISTNPDVHMKDYNKETGTYKIKFAIGGETRILYMREDDAHTVSVKCTLNGVTFEKSYKLSIKRNISINTMLIFSDICKVLKIHPAKELLKSKRLWDNVTKYVSEVLRSGKYHSYTSKKVNYRVDNIIPSAINLCDSKYEILMKFYNNEKIVGERILVVDLNYDNFDIKNSRSRSIKALSDLREDYYITHMMFTMHYKYDSTDSFDIKHDASFDEDEIKQAFLFTTFDLLDNNKKYQLSSDDERRETNNPNSPYYCGKVDM